MNGGLFVPFDGRMNRKTKLALIVAFMDSGEHCSATGLTARIIAQHCLENNFEFSVEYKAVPSPHYLVKLTGAEKAPWSSETATEQQGQAQGVVDGIVRAVAELPDRNSPEDWPEAMLVTADELTRIVGAALTGERNG